MEPVKADLHWLFSIGFFPGAAGGVFHLSLGFFSADVGACLILW